MRIFRKLSDSETQALRQYYSSGHFSYEEFLEELHHHDLRLHEANPHLVYGGNGKVDPEERRKDGWPAKRALLHQACAAVQSVDPLDGIVYVEFGVRAGRSMGEVSSTILARSARFYGLDTFTGLPDGWVPAGGRNAAIGKPRPPGEMAVEKMPDFKDRRVILIKGLFQDAFPLVAPQLHRKRLFVNIDGDTYTGALFALTQTHPFLKTGDIIYFDELLDRLNEYAAYNDYIRTFYMKDRLKPMGRAYDAVLFQVID